jgi:hypothetical protein
LSSVTSFTVVNAFSGEPFASDYENGLFSSSSSSSTFCFLGRPRFLGWDSSDFASDFIDF